MVTAARDPKSLPRCDTPRQITLKEEDVVSINERAGAARAAGGFGR